MHINQRVRWEYEGGQAGNQLKVIEMGLWLMPIHKEVYKMSRLDQSINIQLHPPNQVVFFHIFIDETD